MHRTTEEWRVLWDALYVGGQARAFVEELLDDLAAARGQAARRLVRLQRAYPLLGVGAYVLEEEEGQEPDGSTYVDADTGATLCAACNEPMGQHLRGCVHGAYGAVRRKEGRSWERNA